MYGGKVEEKEGGGQKKGKLVGRVKNDQKFKIESI